MNMLIHFLLATTLIVGLILLRTLTARYALRIRSCGSPDNVECMRAGCFREHGAAETTPDDSSVRTRNENKRSAYHAH